MATVMVVLSLQPPALLTANCTKATWLMVVVLAGAVKSTVLSVRLLKYVAGLHWAVLLFRLMAVSVSACPLHKVIALTACATGRGYMVYV